MSDLNSIDKLMEIANFLNAKNLEAELSTIKERSMQPQAELIFPLIGEFSAGKTTLINALTDCKKLETATQPTTATIYEIHFGCDRCHATVLNEQGELEEVEDIASLKNERLANATVVNIFDTSTRIPSTTILVDTPGLSSPNPKHKQTLVNFLPNADGILLVTDVNQQITRSLTDFIEMMKLSKRPIYLVITKCDTKSKPELEAVKKYISDNSQLPIQQMACVSATQNEMDELYALLATIQKDKNAILAKVNEQRIKNIVSELLKQIDELLSSSSSDSSMDEAIRQQEHELKRLNRNIDKLINDTKADVQKEGDNTILQFQDIVSDKLEELVSSKRDDYDNAAVSLINNTSTLLLNEYKSKIEEILRVKANASKDTDDAITLHSLAEIDLSEFSIGNISYNLDLNRTGHKNDAVISSASQIAVKAGGKAYLNKVAENSENSKLQKFAKDEELVEQAFVLIEEIVDSLVGFIIEKTMGKPQRKRAIREYMAEVLIPSFTKEMDRIGLQVVSLVRDALHQEAAETIAQKNETLRRLKKDRSENNVLFEQRMNQLHNYKSLLVTI